MFPYLEISGIKFYMTGIGIIIFLVCFIFIAYHLCKKWHQDFLRLFYRLPVCIAITYILGAYVYFFLNVSIIPKSIGDIQLLLSPNGYKFHFIGILLGIIISLIIFFAKIKRNDNKNIWIDIIYFSTAISLIPLGIFFVLGDNFIGKSSIGLLSVKPLTIGSEINKIGSVHPVGLYLSLVAIFSLLLTIVIKSYKKNFGKGLIGFIFLLIGINIVFMFQQAPRYGVLALGKITFDIRQYLSFFVIMLCINLYYKRKQQ